MSNPKENAAMAENQKNRLVKLHPASWSIRVKIRALFLASVFSILCFLTASVYLVQRKASVKDAYEKVTLLRTANTRLAESWFRDLAEKMKTFSTGSGSLDALTLLQESFMNIENDNYFLPGTESLDKVNSQLEGYYTAEILPLLESVSQKTVAISRLLPDDNRQRILQYLYLAGNPKPPGFKQSLIKSTDGSAYSSIHGQWHPNMLTLARQAGISDLILVDYKSGYVVYSMKKNPDFASNLYEGPYKNSALGLAFKTAAGLPAGEVVYTDETLYPGAFMKPVFFLSAPVYKGSELRGVAIFELEATALDALFAMDGDNLRSSSLKNLVMGFDMKLRSNDPEYVKNPESYIRKLRRNGTSGVAPTVGLLKTNAMIQQVDPLAFSKVAGGKELITTYNTETGKKVLCSAGPMQIKGLNWFLISQMDKKEALAPVHRLAWILVGSALVLSVLLFLLIMNFTNRLSNRLTGLKEMLLAVNRGEKVETLPVHGWDEIHGSLDAACRLSVRISSASRAIEEMGKGNIENLVAVQGEGDQLGLSLNKLKDGLAHAREEEDKRKKEDELRNWSAHGIALFNDILRSNNDNLEKLSLDVVRNMIQYLSANQGGIFLIEEDEEKYLNLVASYAFDRQKFLKKKIGIGEGLAGACVQEGKTILLRKLPEDYIEITSGLGGARPGCLLIVPLKKDEEILGVLEIASFNVFLSHEVEFVEKVAESIASALITVRLHTQTSQYLERFQQQAEEMKAQDEELRQNIEELQATHEQMERLKQEEDERNRRMIKEMDDYRKLLISVLNEVPEKIFLKDDKGRFLIANKPVADNYGRTVEEILGKSDFDFYSREEATEYLKYEQDIISSGKPLIYEEGDPSRYDGLIVRSIKKPFYIEHLGITGLFGVQMDITDIKRKEYEATKLVEEINSKQDELQSEKALLDSLLNNVPECIYFKDKESRFIRFSKSMLDLFGLKSPEELLGKSDFDFFDEEHARPAFEDEQKIIRTGEAIIDMEEREVMEDGRVSWVNTTKMPLRNSNGEIVGTFGISKSISHIKNMEIEARGMMQTLDSNRKLLIDILNRVPAKVFLKDENGVFVVVNRAVASVYNKEPEQLIGTSDYDNHPDEDVDSWRAQELEIIQRGESTYLHKESLQGKTAYLKTTKMPFTLATTGQTGLLGIQFDITETKMLEERVQELNEEVQRLKK